MKTIFLALLLFAASPAFASEIECQATDGAINSPTLNFKTADNLATQVTVLDILSVGVFEAKYKLKATPDAAIVDGVLTVNLAVDIPINGVIVHLDGKLVLNTLPLLTGTLSPEGTGDLFITGDLSHFSSPSISPHYTLSGCRGLF